MMDEADEFPFGSGISEQPMAFYTGGDMYYAQGPRRIVEHPAVIGDRKINKHQENVNHNDRCKCKEFKYDDLIVMYEHIEEYPQFRCYCKWCIGKLQADTNCFGEYDQVAIDVAFRVILLEEIKKKGLEFKS